MVNHVICWSGGKDSTASIIIAHQLGIQNVEVVISLPWFDKSSLIYADHPLHVDWILNVAKPKIEKWGFKVTILSDDRDYLYWFFKEIKNSSYPDHNGLFYGFVIGGMCKMNRSKMDPINKFIHNLSSDSFVIEGIASDEKERLERMNKNRNHISLLEVFSIPESETFTICSREGLLSPIYNKRSRGGCWFCPSQNAIEAAEFKKDFPDIWNRLKSLAEITNQGKTYAKCFRYDKTFEQFDHDVDFLMSHPVPMQISIFDDWSLFPFGANSGEE